MKTSVTQFIRYRKLEGSWSTVYRGRPCVNTLMRLPLPRHSYWVRYSVAPDGKYRVGKDNYLTWHNSEGSGEVARVCFLPVEWQGLRVRRQVIKRTR